MDLKNVNSRIDSLLMLLNKQEYLAQFEESNGISAKTSSEGKMRVSPSVASNVIIEIPEGEEVKLFKEFKFPFFKVLYNGKVGYLSYGSLERNKYIELVVSNKREKQDDIKSASKESSVTAKYAIVFNMLDLGMTKQQVLDIVNKPNDINRTVSTYGTREQWVYPNSVYLYFENGKLTTWQD